MYFKGLLQKDGWHENVEVKTGTEGIILSIDKTSDPCEGYALPGFRNAHSHAFQYAMAGIAENHSNPRDDFWSWREAMYKLALEVDPDQLEAIAAMLYSEMLRHGYTHVAEFHYLHHDKNGAPYENLAEMGSRLIAAAARTGINITLVPVYYKTGGFGKSASESQRRFIFEDVDQYFRLVEATAHECKNHPHANCGFGVHSLRAAPADDIVEISKNGPTDSPFHIHIAEQLKEVEECQAFYGARPVEWFMDVVGMLSENVNLVHATYLLEHELKTIAVAGANVVLCPTTEGNLGDGIFSLKHFKTNGGRWSIGSDSNVSLNPFEEIRLLDYGQRLVSRSRNTYGAKGSQYAIETAFDAGCDAVGNEAIDFFEVGKTFNACVISSEHPLIEETSVVNRLNTIVYSSDASLHDGAVSIGKRVSGDTAETLGVRDEFRNTIRNLCNR